MELHWIKLTPRLSAGLVHINELDNSKLEKLIERILLNLKNQIAGLFTEQEWCKLEKVFKLDRNDLEITIKTIVYIIKRMLKFLIMPADFKSDLITLGLKADIADSFIKVWSAETSNILNRQVEPQSEVQCNLNVELCSDVSKKSKTPKLYLSIGDHEMELGHSNVNYIFKQLEAVQNELDNFFE